MAEARHILPKAVKQYVTEVTKSAHQYKVTVGETLDEFNTADFLDTYNFNKRLKSKFQPNEFLMIENVSRTDVVNP